MISLTSTVCRAKRKSYKPKTVKKWASNLQLLTDFDRRCSGAHFVYFLFHYYCKLVGSFFEFVQITYELLSLGGCNYYLVKVGRRKSREIHTSFLILSKEHWGLIITKEHSYFFYFY